MKYQCDLHIHSAFSPDALDSPKKIVAAAKKKKLKAIAIADHNGTLGLAQMKRHCRRAKIDSLEGIEISSRYKKIDMHILGYALNFDQALLHKKLSPLIAGYNLRAKKLFANAQKAGLIDKNINFNNYFCRKNKLYVATREIQKLVADQNHIPYPEAEKLLGRGSRLYVKMPPQGLLDPKKTSALIHASGGISVIAHPYYIVRNPLAKMNPKKYLLKIIKYGGFDGIEAYYPKHTAAEERLFLQIAREKHLIVTGGSDWHGKAFTPERPIGCRGVTQGELEKIIIVLLKKYGRTAA